ncbi:unnamed protein product [Pedinophyceae sp. YPF-701]|nr:unnamed protein product [Pedinophyceae sp. YPF-701]
MASGDERMEVSDAEANATFELQHEDHTLANAARFMLNKNPHVQFAGYSMPHPSEPVVNIRVQTTGEVTATEAFRQSLQDLTACCAALREAFDAKVREKQASADAGR